MKAKRLAPPNALEALEGAGRHESFPEAVTEQGVMSGGIGRQRETA